MNIGEPDFWRRAGRILNSGQSRALLLSGAIHDLFFLEESGEWGEYVPLIELLCAKWDLPEWIVVVYELNGPIRFLRVAGRAKLRDAWLNWRTGLDANELAVKKMFSSAKLRAELEQLGRSFEENLSQAIGKPTAALELLRQLCLCSRSELNGAPLLRENLLVLIEGADLLMPEGEIPQLSDADRRRISICHDWFSDPDFNNSGDAVVLLAESRSLLNRRVARLPQVAGVEIPAPGAEERQRLIQWFKRRHPNAAKLQFQDSLESLVQFSAGLSIRALQQLLKSAAHGGEMLTMQQVIRKVEEHIQGQLGEDVVAFKKPGHKLDSVVGFSRLKKFLREELIPRLRATGPEALPGAAVCGPIGGGKTFIFEALAAELDVPVLELKNLRSQWFGQTDVIFERLKRALDALTKVVIFLDEADTQLGGAGPETHETERRLTGKMLALMSDPQARGRVIWLLMTARIHRLAPDFRRPGRAGDLIIPVLDPDEADRLEFLKWCVGESAAEELSDDEWRELDAALPGAYSASFAALRSELRARALQRPLTFAEIRAIFADQLPSAIAEARRYQTLQALLNCTRRCLLPDPELDPRRREEWAREIRELEARGMQ